MISVGQKLKEKRLERGLTIEDVAKATKIRVNFLSAIEKGEYAKLPSSTYALGFMKNYIEFLEMPVKETLALFKREFNEEKIFKVLPEGLSSKEEFPIKRIQFQDTIKIIIAVFVALLIYTLFQYKSAIISPSLKIDTPKEGTVSISQSITVSGKTDSNTAVFVNGQPASLESNGRFSKIITLFVGKTTITIKAVNNFGRQKIVERQIEVR